MSLGENKINSSSGDKTECNEPSGETEVKTETEPGDSKESDGDALLKRGRDANGENRLPSPPTKRSRHNETSLEDKNSRKSDDRDKNGVRRKDDEKERTKHGDGDEKKRKKVEKEKDRKSRRSKSRSRSPDSKRRRSERGKDRKKDKDDEKRDKDKKENGKKATEDDHDGIEEGEVLDVPPPIREPTARELERMRIIQEELMNGGEGEDEDEPVWSMRKAQQEKSSRSCPYLDTIDRSVLDFDFEKLCSVSLSHLNVYACMVCGKYFQGRGTNTHAYTHSLDTDHRVFLNLHTLKFYCLPDNYEVDDPSLEDIKYVLKPTYSKELISGLDRQVRMARAYDDSTYFPGVVGLNNIKANDYCNCILHALSHVTPLRDYFLREQNYENIKRPPGDKLDLLPKRFGELIRKLWNPKAFRTHVSPHEMLQATVICSEKRFQFTNLSKEDRNTSLAYLGDAAEFMNFLLNTLHIALNGTNKTSSSIIYKIFRGRMRQYSRRVIPAEAGEERRQQLLQLDEYKETAKELPFLYLTLDLPPAPLYRDEQMQNIIPQVPLQALLQKFNGTTEKEYKTYNENIMKRFELLRLPEYLIITYKRFQKNQWFVEKNSTIVNFPISNVDLFECLTEDVRSEHKYTTYDLVANVVHEGKPDSGNYRIQLVHTGSQKWFELEDLHVKEILPQMIVLAESYIQIWRLNRKKTREERMSESVDGEQLST